MANSTYPKVPQIIGRHAELECLNKILSSPNAEFLAIYGRRRVGKTFLIHEFFCNKGIYLEITGSQGDSKEQQIEDFCQECALAFDDFSPLPLPKNWHEALHRLTQSIRSRSKKVILFFDELPWLDSPRSGFLSALGYYWNRHFSRMPRLKMIVCGSAASWMIRRVVEPKKGTAGSGLYGRLSATLALQPFHLLEVEEFLAAKQIELPRRQIVELYMAVGGIPHYLNQIQRGQSLGQTIDALCFHPQGILFKEFPRLFRTLFDESEKHRRLMEALAQHHYGLPQSELLKKAQMEATGRSTEILHELEEAGFFMVLPTFNKKKKEKIWRLADEYSRFYLRWIAPNQSTILQGGEEGTWSHQQATPPYYSWAGYAFEGICLKHLHSIRQALGIGNVQTLASHWSQTKPAGAQIDLILDRADGCINLCEIKFSQKLFTITPSFAKELETKRDLFREATRTKKALMLTLITPYGIATSPYQGVIDTELHLEALFHQPFRHRPLSPHSVL